MSELAISFNGGKDSYVTLLLLIVSLYLNFIDNKSFNSDNIQNEFNLNSIYIHQEDSFSEVTDFVKTTNNLFSLKSITLSMDLKTGFRHYKQFINPNLKGVFIGIRQSDHKDKLLKDKEYSDNDWPFFLRIHPVLEWKYKEIWDFLIGCDFCYCKIYDSGYSSLGLLSNTIKNPFLKNINEPYLPAYLLDDDNDEKERLSRIT